MGAVMTVGDFSRVTHLSIKTLRHYHEVGLLEPAAVDPGNGYRYYRPEQVPTAQVIRRLRDLGMPVAEVKAVLVADDLGERNAVIAAHLDRLEAELAATRSSVDSLRNLLRQPAKAASIEHRTVGAASAVAVHATVDREEIFEWWQGALGELRAAVRVQGLRETGPSGGLYASELFQQDRGEATVFIPVEGAVRAVGRVAAFEVPAAELAVLAHHGALCDVDLSYAELGGYTMRHEISVEGPVREYYLRDFHDTADPAEWVTELCWPVFRADAGA